MCANRASVPVIPSLMFDPSFSARVATSLRTRMRSLISGTLVKSPATSFAKALAVQVSFCTAATVPLVSKNRVPTPVGFPLNRTST